MLSARANATRSKPGRGTVLPGLRPRENQWAPNLACCHPGAKSSNACWTMRLKSSGSSARPCGPRGGS
eukprot:8175301-Lingulodinium_polyedra.AAC.1